MELKALPVKVPIGLYDKLTALAERTHRTRAHYIREALTRYLEDREDIEAALAARANPGKTISLDQLINRLGITNEELAEIELDN